MEPLPPERSALRDPQLPEAAWRAWAKSLGLDGSRDLPELHVALANVQARQLRPPGQSPASRRTSSQDATRGGPHSVPRRLLAASAAADMGPFRVQLGKTFAQMER